MMRRILLSLAAAVLTLQMAGCGSSMDQDRSGSESPTAKTEATQAPTPSLPHDSSGIAPSPVGTTETAADTASQVKNAAKEVIEALRDRDLKRLARMVDESKGLRFSPYAHIDKDKGNLFSYDKLPSFKSTDTYNWGEADGSGDPIKLTFRAYFEKYVYDQDFASAPQITFNKLVGKGNTPYNGLEIYPDSVYVEYHFPGFDTEQKGMDWESLILTFQPSGKDWRLIAISHSQWTI